MAFNGKWKNTAEETSEGLFAYVGLTKEVIEGFKDAESILEIEHEGDTVKEVHTAGSIVSKTNYTVGKESEIPNWSGGKVKVHPVYVENNKSKIKIEYEENGIHHSYLRELVSENVFVDHMNLDNGKHVGKFTYTKC